MKLYRQNFTYKDKFGRDEAIKLDKLEGYVRRFGPKLAADVYRRAWGIRPQRVGEFNQKIEEAINYLRKQYIYRSLIEDLNVIQNS